MPGVVLSIVAAGTLVAASDVARQQGARMSDGLVKE
jgi:hypothetical protein